MNRDTGFPIALSLFAMELIWIYSWANFIMTNAFDRPFPLSSAICASGLAFLLTALAMGRGWRWIQIIAVQLLGLGLVCLWTLYLAEKPALSFFDRAWITAFFSNPKTFLQWAALSTSLFWILFFWIGGIAQSRRPDTYDAISNRFDLGVAALLFLLLIELVILVKSGPAPAAPLTAGGLFSFFIFSVLAFSLIRNRGDGHKGFIAGYQGISTVVSFAAIILLLSTALLSFLLPYLTLTAQAGYKVLKILSQPVGHVIIKILRFIFTNRELRSDPSSNSHSPPGSATNIPVAEAGWVDFLMAILGWVLMGIGILAAILVISFLLWKLLKLLLTRTASKKERPATWQKLTGWILNTLQLLFGWMARIRSRLRRPQTAVQLYLSLIAWGRRSGISPLPSDTPLEYGLRLRKKFPSIDNEIQTIITTHNTLVYGRVSDVPDPLTGAKASLGRLGSPILWPARLRSRLFPGWLGQHDN